MLDWIFSFFDKIAQNVAIRMIVEHFQWVDWFAALFIILGIVYGMQNGFICEIAEIVQIMAVIFLTLEFYERLKIVIQTLLTAIPDQMVSGVAYGLTGIAIWAALAVLYKYLAKIFHTDVPKPLRVGGGAVLGGVHLLIIFSFFCQAVILLPYQHAKKPLTGGTSYTGRYVAELAPRIHRMIAEPLKTILPESKKS